MRNQEALIIATGVRYLFFTLLIAVAFPRTLYYWFVPPTPAYALSAAGNALIPLYTAYYIVRRVVFRGWFFSSFELYLVLLLFMPILSGIMAYLIFHQPIHYGILTQRTVWLAGIAFVVLHSLRHGFITLEEIQRILIGCAWLTVTVYFTARFLGMGYLSQAQSSAMEEAGKSLAVAGGEQSLRGYRVRFQIMFVVFALHYYISRALVERRVRDYAAAFVLALVFIDYGGRSLLVMTFVSILLVSFSWRLNVLMTRILFVGSAVLFFVLGGYLLVPEHMKLWLELFGNALAGLSGTTTDEGSIDIRIYEAAIAWSYIRDYCWPIGCGDISNQWMGGYEGILGYFYPADVGWLGILFNYGLAGFILLHWQCYFAVKYLYSIGSSVEIHLVTAIKGFLIYFVLHSVTTGIILSHVSASMLFLAILYFIYEQARMNKILSSSQSMKKCQSLSSSSATI